MAALVLVMPDRGGGVQRAVAASLILDAAPRQGTDAPPDPAFQTIAHRPSPVHPGGVTTVRAPARHHRVMKTLPRLIPYPPGDFGTYCIGVAGADNRFDTVIEHIGRITAVQLISKVGSH